MESIEIIRDKNLRDLCLTSSTLDTRWHSDNAKRYGNNLVQVEAQFGKMEAMFKDLCGFRIAYAERRLALGIEIVLVDPPRYFSHRKNAVGGMASFDIAKNILLSLKRSCGGTLKLGEKFSCRFWTMPRRLPGRITTGLKNNGGISQMDANRCCVCMAFFGGYCLDNAGFSTFVRHLKGNRDQHGVLVIKDVDKYWIAVDYTGRSGGRNRMSGPHSSIAGVDKEIMKTTGTSVRQSRYIRKRY